MSYAGHSLQGWRFYPFAEMQLVYRTAQAEWAVQKNVGVRPYNFDHTDHPSMKNRTHRDTAEEQ